MRRSMSAERPGETGTMLPPLIDHHVHLMIIGPDALCDTALAGVVDLGGPLDTIASHARRDGLPKVAFAGSFLTAPGGYPVGRAWASPGSAREIVVEAGDERAALPTAAETAVAEQLAFGASVIKVALNREAGPVLDAATLAAVVASAHAAGVPVVAHVEGEGMSRLAIDAGVDAFAHTPFTERLDDDLVARAVAAGQCWISTLFVAGYGEPTPETAIALDNLGRFHAAGGRVLYGTDLGNGEQPLGVNPAELALLVRAGLGASAVLDALTDPWPGGPDEAGDGAVATFVPGEPPATLDEFPAWLASARLSPAEDLEQL
ncbi:Imidazolonepropionase [Agromyces cerinus subsp. cerinus]|uniref:Imidazolonepropionase n=2 Tax=Agromyces cerinus TaxID=33878 RepID=A0A1N6ETY0_9MICO|nr:Imidazolonepropionase [Agromyces cerinus subsp. cerinus]